jgi:hypothetical protein
MRIPLQSRYVNLQESPEESFGYFRGNAVVVGSTLGHTFPHAEVGVRPLGGGGGGGGGNFRDTCLGPGGLCCSGDSISRCVCSLGETAILTGTSCTFLGRPSRICRCRSRSGGGGGGK